MKYPAKVVLLLIIMILASSILAGMALGKVKLVKGQTLYLPIATNYMKDDVSFRVTAEVIIHNTDPDHAINLVKMDFYDTDGKLVKSYLQEPLKLNPASGRRFRVKDSVPDAAGAAAHFIIQWQADNKVVAPLVSGLLLGSRGTRGYAITTAPRIIRETAD